eukprot:1182482-Prorocentrum_minimum.AAC.2
MPKGTGRVDSGAGRAPASGRDMDMRGGRLGQRHARTGVYPGRVIKRAGDLSRITPSFISTLPYLRRHFVGLTPDANAQMWARIKPGGITARAAKCAGDGQGSGTAVRMIKYLMLAAPCDYVLASAHFCSLLLTSSHFCAIVVVARPKTNV